jgi:hypothetical protein
VPAHGGRMDAPDAACPDDTEVDTHLLWSPR